MMMELDQQNYNLNIGRSHSIQNRLRNQSSIANMQKMSKIIYQAGALSSRHLGTFGFNNINKNKPLIPKHLSVSSDDGNNDNNIYNNNDSNNDNKINNNDSNNSVNVDIPVSLSKISKKSYQNVYPISQQNLKISVSNSSINLNLNLPFSDINETKELEIQSRVKSNNIDDLIPTLGTLGHMESVNSVGMLLIYYIFAYNIL